MATGEQVAVSCRAVVRVYGSATEETQALRGIDLALRRHELTVVTGPSGSGKSSLLGLVSARDEPSAGWVEVLGHDLGTTPRRVLRDLRRREVALGAAADLERALPRPRRARPPRPGGPVARRADRRRGWATSSTASASATASGARPRRSRAASSSG